MKVQLLRLLKPYRLSFYLSVIFLLTVHVVCHAILCRFYLSWTRQFERPLSSCKIIDTLIVRPLCKIIRHVSVHVASLLAHSTFCHGVLFVSAVFLFIYTFF